MLVIYLHSNNFTSVGVKALLNCVFDSSSLNAISESNHTLNGMCFFNNNTVINNKPIERLEGFRRLFFLDRKEKIMLALQDKYSLLKYLSNVPVELIAEVLAFALQPADDPYQQVVHQPQRKHLNIVYCTMRWWNMPLLYSHYNCVMSDTKRRQEMTVQDCNGGKIVFLFGLGV